MRFVADHKMTFEWVDDSKDIIPTIPNPMYIPRVGDIIKFSLLDQPKSEFYDVEVKVVSVKILIHDTIVGEQTVVVSITKDLS